MALLNPKYISTNDEHNPVTLQQRMLRRGATCSKNLCWQFPETPWWVLELVTERASRSPKMYAPLHCVVVWLGGSCLVRNCIFHAMFRSKCGHVTNSCQWNVNRVRGITSRWKFLVSGYLFSTISFPFFELDAEVSERPVGESQHGRNMNSWVTIWSKVPTYLPTTAMWITWTRRNLSY